MTLGVCGRNRDFIDLETQRLGPKVLIALEAADVFCPVERFPMNTLELL